MDTKGLKHRKRQKQSKSGTDKRNSEVLVVPPDILKKLGINIGNSKTDHQVSDFAASNTNNASISEVQTEYLNKKSSESSILETANLMKKSVFLSPTFIPTAVNMISGEVEISNTRDNDDSRKVTENPTLENGMQKSLYCESIYDDTQDQESSTNTANVYLNGVGNNSCFFNVTLKQSETPIQQVENGIIVEDSKTTHTDYSKVLSEQRSHHRMSPENNDCDLTSSQKLNACQFSVGIVDETSNSKSEGDINNISITNSHIKINANTNSFPKKIDKVEVDKVAIDSISLTGHKAVLMALPEDGNKSNYFKTREIQNQQTDFVSNVIVLKGNQIEIEKDDAGDNSSLEEKVPEMEQVLENLSSGHDFSKNKITELQNDVTTIGGEDSSLKQNKNNIIALQNITVDEFSINNSDISNVENNNLLVSQNITKSLQDDINPRQETRTDKNPPYSEYAEMKIEPTQNDSNPNSLYDGTPKIQTETMNSNTFLDEQHIVVQNVSKDYLEDLVEVNKLKICTGFDTESQPVLTESEIITSVNISRTPKTMEYLNNNEIQYNEMKQADSNIIAFNKCDDTEQLCDSSLKKKTDTDFDLNNTDTTSSMVVPAAKVVQKINIISEEIIPPLDLKDLKMSHSPAIRSLTPVPLNSIIAPKRTFDYTSEAMVVGNRNCAISANQSEVQTSEMNVRKSSNILPILNEVDSPSDIDTTAILMAKNVETTKNSESSLMKGDIRNNNVFFNSTVNRASNIKHSKQLINSDCNKFVPKGNEALVIQSVNVADELPKLEINANNCNQISKDHHHTSNEQNSRVKCHDRSLVRKSSCDSSFRKDNYKYNKESVTDMKDSRDQLEKKKKKKKKMNESKNINVIGVENKEFCNNEINEIVKSHKENSDTNANLSKVKAIAEHIKKYAHIYKDNKLIVNKVVGNKKGSITSKSNMIKSKLCIQGVEKPGGNNSEKKSFDNAPLLKTYTRQKKHNKPYTSKFSGDSKIAPCDVFIDTDSDLNTVNIPKSHKTQDFCLCNDFGRLDASIYTNSYEHIHFWLHEETTDIESIFRIYNDDEEVFNNDRTKLGDIKINEVTESNTKTRDICWNYFFINEEENHRSEETTNVPDMAINDDSQVALSAIQESGSSSVINEVITIVEVSDDPNVHWKTTETNYMEIVDTADKKPNSKTDDGKPGTSKSKTVKMLNKETSVFESKSSNQSQRKRSLPVDGNSEVSHPKKNVKCGVCNKILYEAQWNTHVANKHNYIAWRAGESFNFDDPELLKKLRQKFKSVGSLKCSKCHTQTTKFEKFIGHLKTCTKQKETSSKRASSSKDMVTCGVCHRTVEYLSWYEHIGKEHNYLAWIEGTDGLNVEDAAAVAKHLQNIIKCNGDLICYKCGLGRQRVKLYLTHIETCKGNENRMHNSSIGIDMDISNVEEDTEPSTSDKKSTKCGVCKQQIPLLEWTKHIGKEHNYLAWEDGATPLDLDDEEVVRDHLQEFIRHSGGLRCYKCGLNRKRVKPYLSHIATCDGEEVDCDESALQDISVEQTSSDTKTFECGVCNAQVSISNWYEHIGREHNYSAWKVGDTPLDVNNEDAVKEHLLHIIRNCEGLICYKCGLSRKRAKLYLDHIQTCRGAETGESNLDQSTTSSLNLSATSIEMEITSQESERIVKCRVCEHDVAARMWVEHMGREHKYLAWQLGQEPLSNLDQSTTSNLNLTANSIEIEISTQENERIVKCGVCEQDVAARMWVEHIGREHKYLAWQLGQEPLDLDNKEMVQAHLLNISRQNKGLTCYLCNVVKKYPKTYMHHVQECTGVVSNLDQSTTSSLNLTANSIKIERTTQESERIVKCGVCEQDVAARMWVEHIGREHKYLAWQLGQEPLDLENKEMVQAHLLNISRQNNGLTCYLCNVVKKYPKTYVQHVQECTGVVSNLDRSAASNLTATFDEIDVTKEVKCGVCDQDVAGSMWVEHIGREHKYLAWPLGQGPLDLENKEMVKAHLVNISRQNNGLICYLCNVTKKYPKCFMNHVQVCTGVEDIDNSKEEDALEISLFDISDVTTDTVICGACNKVVVKGDWLKHMELDHEYLAWLQGKPPLDLNDSAMVQRHLMEVSKCTGGLTCKSCGVVRKYVKSYLQHTQYCKTGQKVNDAAVMIGKDSVTCAVCSATVRPKDWRKHAMKEHYNVAWLIGATPIEINNPYGVEPYIKEYQLRHDNKLVCKTCGISRVSAVGFYAHIITCGKTDEETEIYKSVCDICNCKYLRIYRSQHMTMHREQEYALERKLLIAKEKELINEADEPVQIVGGRRKAAEKAQTVIENYTSNKGNGPCCRKCGFASDVESEMLNHVCVENDGSDSDESVKIDYSSEEDDDTDFDSNISDEEREAWDREQIKPKKHSDSSCKVKRLPYPINSVNSYMKRSAEEFVTLHLTDEDIFSQYHNIEYEIIDETDLPKYLPPVEESCKVRYSENDSWITYKRFGTNFNKGIATVFTGACIQNMYWVPPYVGVHRETPTNEYLSVLMSSTSDMPKQYWYDKPAPAPALIQIWDCGTGINCAPELAMGLVLDYGIIWAIDWCPSGTRDVFDTVEDCNEVRRLGLFAAASANGSAYVFVVPHPATMREKGRFYKLKPVVELRLAMNASRKVHQATAIKWSAQKGHEHIVVGYADGTAAYFDLKTDSPLLKSTENNIEIIYPYDDERAQNMCIEDVGVFPGREGARGAGVVVTGSAGGSGSRHVHVHAPATRVLFPPHWPAALLTGDDNLVSQAINEVEWYGSGRRLGGMRAAGGCAWCGHLAVGTAPLVRLLRVHPAHADMYRLVIASLQMVPFGNKRKRKNDELSMIMEPLTYNEAVLKYGIEFKQIKTKDKNTQRKMTSMPREAFSERFPLADITSLEFCPSYKNHQKLAMSTHAGLIFIINV